MNTNYKNNILVFSLTVLVFTSCKVTQNYRSPQINTNGLFRDAITTDTTSIAKLHWNEIFTDTILQNLIAEGIAQNLDLKVGTVFRHYDQNKGDAIDFNAVIWIKKWLGIGLWKNKSGSEINPNNAFIITADAQISQKFRLGISYDTATNSKYDPINPQTGRSSNLGLYTFTLRYDFDNLTGKINNFRFF